MDIQELLAAVRADFARNPAEWLEKLEKSGWNLPGGATTGINYYDLEAGAKSLFPVITPLRNRIPRVSGKGGIQANWRAITGINVNNIVGVASDGNRSAVTTTSTQDYTAAYKQIGLEDFVTFGADLAAQGFDDLKAIAVRNLLYSLMIEEEKLILGGNNSLGLGTTPTPSLAASTTGGALATQTLSVICVALTFDGYRTGSVASGIQASVSRTNADGSTDTYGGGSAQKSANATASITGPTGSCAATVAAVTGAVAYAWFWGAAGSEKLGAITTINSVSITDVAAGTQTAASLPSSDNSKNTLEFDGLLTMTANSTYGGYYVSQATGTAGTGTPLTSDTSGGIVEIDNALRYFWDNYRLSPTDMFVSSQEQQNIYKKILTSSTAGAQRFVYNVEQGVLAGGAMVRSYLNKFSMSGAKEIPIHLHPNMPPGTIMFFTDKLPYPLSNVTNVLQIRALRDYYQIEWPMRTRKYEYGVYSHEVLQNYFPPAFGVITNIGNG